ncbi:DUF3857 domain-containing protein [Ascidiimonas sp. W6]|uniref:DUF3857 domain-containing protein n=1 Tax=Ascidiimonas meishanensis TaxID=3128903 RepID=UPI0030EC266E
MKKLFILILLISPTVTFSQYYKGYDWNSKPEVVKLTNEEEKESSVGIIEKLIVEFTPSGANGKQYETTHTLVKVNDEKGIQQHNKVYIPMYGVKELKEIKARTISPNGTVRLLDEKNIKEVQNVEAYGDFKIFAIEGVEKGSDIEVLYTVEKEAYPFGMETLQKDYPVRFSEFLFITGDLTGKAKAYGTSKEFINLIVSNRKAQKITVTNLPAMIEEEYATPDANKVRIAYQCFGKGVKVTQEQLWINVINNISGGLFPSQVNEQVFKEVEEKVVKNNELSSYQKAALLDNYIKTNFTIVKNNNQQLSEVDYILENRSASDFGIAKVYAHFLKAMNIEYEVVISANRFQQKFDPEFFNPQTIREFLIYLPNEQQYIAPDRIDYRIGEAPFYLLGNQAVYVNKDLEFYFAEITQADANFSRIVRNIDISFDEEMESAEIMQHQEYYGHWATSNRSFVTFSSPQDRKDFDDYLTASGIENKTVQNYELLNEKLYQEEYNVPFVVNSTITSGALLEEAGDSYIFEVGKVIGTQSELYQEKERVNPIEMQYPNKYNYSIKVAIPEGYTPEGLESLVINEKLLKEENLLCSFKSNYEIVTNTIHITIEEIYAVNKFPKENYEDFRKVINAASDFNKATILFSAE